MGLRLSVLDQSPISEGMTGSEALHNTIDLAQLADALGYHRYWVAEHHGGPMLAGPSPEALIGPIASATRGHPRRLRRRDAPALLAVQGRRDLQRAGRPLSRPDRPRARPRRRHRPDDHPRAAARPLEGDARRLPGAAGRAAGLLRGHDPDLQPARAAGEDPPRPAGDAGAVAARLIAAERGVGGRARPPLRVRGLHQLQRRRDRRALPAGVRGRRAPRRAAHDRRRLGPGRRHRGGGRTARDQQPDGVHDAAPRPPDRGAAARDRRALPRERGEQRRPDAAADDRRDARLR